MVHTNDAKQTHRQGRLGSGSWTHRLPSGLAATTDLLWTEQNLHYCGDKGRLTPTGEVEDVIVLLPGNPGVVDWYRRFLSQVVLRSSGRAACIAVGYAGHHANKKLTPGHWYVLQDQIELVSEFLHAVVEPSFPRGGAKTPRLHIAGHSIGAFIALQMACRFSYLDRCLLLTPTVCNMRRSPNGRMNSWVLRKPLIAAVSALAGVLNRFLPHRLQQAVVKIAQPRMDESALAIAVGMGGYSTVRNVLTMALSEFDQLTTLDTSLLQMVDDRVFAYYVKHDGWVPLSDMELLKAAAPRATVMLEPNEHVEHAWCLRHSDEVVAAISQVIPSLTVTE